MRTEKRFAGDPRFHSQSGFELVYSGHFSEVFRMHSHHGTAVLKVPRSATPEGAILRVIETFAPLGLIPETLAVWPDCFLSREVKGPKGLAPEMIENFVGRFTEMQIASAAFEENLKSAGITASRIENLSEKADNWLDSELIGIRAAKLAREIQEFKIPPCLEHGDLYTGNLLANENGSVAVIDWSEASYTHPFFSLYSLLYSLENRADVNQASIIEAYLRGWQKFDSMPRLKKLYNLIERLAPLYFALKYLQTAADLAEEIREPYIRFASELMTRFEDEDQSKV